MILDWKRSKLDFLNYLDIDFLLILIVTWRPLQALSMWELQEPPSF